MKQNLYKNLTNIFLYKILYYFDYFGFAEAKGSRVIARFIFQEQVFFFAAVALKNAVNNLVFGKYY